MEVCLASSLGRLNYVDRIRRIYRVRSNKDPKTYWCSEQGPVNSKTLGGIIERDCPHTFHTNQIIEFSWQSVVKQKKVCIMRSISGICYCPSLTMKISSACN